MAVLDGAPAGNGAVASGSVERIARRQANRLNVVGELNRLLEHDERDVVVHVLALAELLVDEPVVDVHLDFRVFEDLRVVIAEPDDVRGLGESDQAMCGGEDVVPRDDHSSAPMG